MNPNSNLIDEIEEDRYYELISGDQNNSEHILEVDLGSETYDDVWRHKYTIMLSSEIPKDHYLYLIFPNHPDPKQHVLKTNNFKSLPKLDNEIDSRLNASRKKTEQAGNIKFVIVYGNFIHKMVNLNGTAYVYWAKRINRKTINNIRNTISENVPVFIEMNGCGKMLSFVPLCGNDNSNEDGNQTDSEFDSLRIVPIPLKQCEFFIPLNKPMFNCESDPRAVEKRHFRTLSHEEALEQSTKLIHDQHNDVSAEELPFDNSSSSGDSSFEISDDNNNNNNNTNPLAIDLRIITKQTVPQPIHHNNNDDSEFDEGTPRDTKFGDRILL